MKILYIVDQYYNHGGIEKILAAKINSLIRDYGYTVHLLTSGQRGNDFIYPLDSHVVHTDLGINYNEGEGFFSKANLLKKIKHRTLLNKKIREIYPDIIISPAFSHDQYFLPFIARKIPKIKEIHFSGSILPKRKFPPSALSLVKYAFAKFDRVVILNDDEKQYFQGMNLVVIPNFVDCGLSFSKNSNKEKTVISAGRIAPVKQFDHLLKAWGMIEDRFPEWQLKIFGDGEQNYVERLKELVRELGLKRAEFPGAVSNLNEVMAASSLFAMSSANECFPMVLLEAKCAGLAVVSYDSPNGPRNIIKGDGLLVENGNIKQLSEAIDKMLTDDQLLQAKSKKAIEESTSFSKEAIMPLWIELFNQLKHEQKNKSRSL